MVTVRPHQGQGALVLVDPSISGFSSHGEQLHRCAAKAAEKAAARVNAAALDDAQPLVADDASSAAAATIPAAPVAADARGESPRANDDGSQVEIIYSW